MVPWFQPWPQRLEQVTKDHAWPPGRRIHRETSRPFCRPFRRPQVSADLTELGHLGGGTPQVRGWSRWKCPVDLLRTSEDPPWIIMDHQESAEVGLFSNLTAPEDDQVSTLGDG